MPIKNDPAAVQQQIQHALRNNILSSREAGRLLDHIKQDGVTEEEVKVVVDTLRAAMAGSPDSVSIDLSTTGRQRNLNYFLGRLNEEQTLPLPGAADAGPAGSVNWLTLMTQQQQADFEILGEPSFSGSDIGVDTNGAISLDDVTLDLTAETPSAELREALWGMNQPALLMSMDEGTLHALQENLADLIDLHIDTPNDQPGKFNKLVTTAAAIGAFVSESEDWTPEMADRALAMLEKAPNPLTKSLLMRGLGNANLNPEQTQALQGFERPEHADELLKFYDNTRNENQRISYSNVKNEAAEFALTALTFAKSPTSIENIEKGMGSWKNLDTQGNHVEPWNAEELGHMNRILETYVDKYPQTAFVYGTFSKEAPVRIAEVTNARAVAEVMPQLDAQPPSLEGFPLTQEQAETIKSLLPSIRDDKSIDNMVRSLATAGALFDDRLPSSYGTPQMPSEPMSPAAFALFEKAALGYKETVDGSEDKKLGFDDFSRSFRKEVEQIHSGLRPRLAELNGQPPQWNGTTLSEEAATFVKDQLFQHTHSVMTADNIGRAIDIFSQHNGGKLEGEGFTRFQDMVNEYKANWPERTTFDFNKLERIASFKVRGLEVPLCTINGQQIGLAEFYGKVGMDVRDAIDTSRQRHDWMADRWGYRAKQSVELLDVVAEQAARNEGPIAELRERYPNAEIEIQATGRDGAHEQFLYAVKDRGRTVGTFAQGSDGSLSSFRGRNNPILFNATVGQDGELNVNIPQSIRPHRYPLQTTYAIGDKIDMEYVDTNATNATEEGEAFSTKSKVLEAEIVSYDASGNYTVKFTNPEGEEKTRTLSMRDIRRANNPHYFKPKASYFSDVTINIQNDEALKGFLDEAQPIIDRYLPADGSTVDMDPTELAKRQKECIDALMDYTRERVKYPASKDSHPDENSAKYHEFVDGYGRFPLGELVKIGKGVCRHQCILEHLLLQQAGIESRLASGAANTSSGNFRGYHIWAEVTLADNQRYLSDQTWNDATVPLWDGAYGTDKRRIEMYYRTERYDGNIELQN